MNKSVVENSQGGEELFETISLGIASGEIILGSLVGIDTNGHPQVSFPQIIQTHCRIEDFKAPVSLVREALKFANEMPLGKASSPFVPIAQDHRIF